MLERAPLGSLAAVVLTLAASSLASAQADAGAPPRPAERGTEDAPAQAVQPVPPGQPRYLATLRAELESMGLDGACDADDPQRAHCAVVLRGPTSRRTFDLRMAYSDVTDTLYLYIDHYLTARADAPSTSTLLRRLMELNWRLLIGKFEWDPASGEVRLAMVMNTDSNFDRRTFRSVVRAIQDQADRLYTELSRIAAPAAPTP